MSMGSLDKKGGLSEDSILKICNVYPAISLDWLLLGKGEMLRPEAQVCTPPSDNSEKIYTTIIADKDRQLAEANQTIGQLRQQLKEKTHSPSATTPQESILA